MIPAAVALLVLVLLAGECVVLWLDQIHRHRAEAAYWEAKAASPGLYDWSKDFDL